MTNPAGSVVLADDKAASAILHEVLAGLANKYSNTFDAVAIPQSAKAFRATYAELLPQFEAARLNSAQRQEIAQTAVDMTSDCVVWRDATGSTPLREALNTAAEPLPLEQHEFSGPAGWTPNLVYRGERWEAPRLSELGEHLATRGIITVEAATALGWVGGSLLDDGAIRLTGRRIAVLGAGAEMAPTRLWLEAGADVLWLDMTSPPASWFEEPGMSGCLLWPRDQTDLLSQPHAIRATLAEFAEAGPIDIGLYAYAPGQARELRLTAAMNAIVESMPQDMIASVTMLVSPTTPTALSSGDQMAMKNRLDTQPTWQSWLHKLGLLGRGDGAARFGNAAASRTVVPIQGASYQAAQYISKNLTAETWAAQEASPRVSANTAAITRTRSLNHPVFAAAFGGASAFGVETMTPRQSRRLNGLLSLHDWLHPQPSKPGHLRVHGGLHLLPYPLEATLRVAAAIGFARAPRLLKGLVKS